MEKQGVKARVLIEMIGAPKDFVDQTLKKITDEIRALEHPKTLAFESFEAEPHEKMFSAFAELEMSFIDYKELSAFCYNYTPSRIELIEPVEFHFSMKEYEDFFNEFLAAVHDNYMIVKRLQADNDLLNMNVINLVKNIIFLTLYDYDKSIDQIAKSIGLSEDKAKMFVDELVKEGRIRKSGDRYALVKENAAEGQKQEGEEMNLKRQVEAVLFSAGRRMGIEEISKLVKASPEDIKPALKELKEEYEGKESSLVLEIEGDEWRLTVKQEHFSTVKDLVPTTDLPKAVTETLAVIAYKQPVMQADIVKIRGNKAYDHIESLVEQELIVKEKKGRSFLVKVTPKFLEYFELPKGKMQVKEVLKQKLAEKGVEIVEGYGKQENGDVDTGQSKLGQLDLYGDGAADAQADGQAEQTEEPDEHAGEESGEDKEAMPLEQPEDDSEKLAEFEDEDSHGDIDKLLKDD